jgi:predicted AlkP superfamily phosphohydrolase/phosphomutase
MKVFVLGLDGATWDILDPLVRAGELPHLARLVERGASGTLRSVFPPLSPVAWTGVMTGKNSGKHGVFEFLEYAHHPLRGRVNSSRAI